MSVLETEDGSSLGVGEGMDGRERSGAKPVAAQQNGLGFDVQFSWLLL